NVIMFIKKAKCKRALVSWLTCVLILLGTHVSLLAQQEDHLVRGQILNEKGEPIQGATVTVQSSTRGVLADEQGRYDIVVGRDGQLVYSYVGYTTQTISVNARIEINVTLNPLADALDEVTVVAFGQQKKESVVG